jgi:hypothetical protein
MPVKLVRLQEGLRVGQQFEIDISDAAAITGKLFVWVAYSRGRHGGVRPSIDYSMKSDTYANFIANNGAKLKFTLRRPGLYTPILIGIANGRPVTFRACTTRVKP